jgi:hypothetical protein
MPQERMSSRNTGMRILGWFRILNIFTNRVED